MKRSLSSLITDTNVREYEVKEININIISESESQARKIFDENKLEELKSSIQKNGLLQPIIVQETEPNKYKLIAGERRLRASKLAGLSEIPCLVKDVGERDAAILGLVENIQRERLNHIEEAIAYKEISEKFSLSPEEIGRLVGKSRAHVSNILRLTNLSDKVYSALKNETVSMGQVRPLINLDSEIQDNILNEIINQKLSSRAVEDRVRNLNLGTYTDEEISHYKNFFEDKTGSKVKISKNINKYKLFLTFDSKENLDDFITKLN
jgi:ParB family chromosome partitioning protein